MAPSSLTTSDAAPAPASQERQADPLAKAIFGLLRYRTEADRRYVLFAARARIVEAGTERTQLSLNALRICLADSDGRLSRGGYDSWRSAQATPSEWPSSEFIRNTFGTWRRAKDAAGADVVGDVLSWRLVSIGNRFSRQEILDGVTAYAATGQALTWSEYLNWAGDYMQRPDRELKRVIRSMNRIRELFGSWGGCLAAAGLGERYLLERHGRFGAMGRRHEGDPQRVIDWVRRAGEATDGGRMSVKTYDAWVRDQRLVELERSQDYLTPPSSQTVSRVLGSWAKALCLAGLISQEEAQQRRSRKGQWLTDDQLLGWLARALEEVDPILIELQYERWRRSWIREHGLDQPIPPSSTYLRRRLGGWPSARQRALSWLEARVAGNSDGGGAKTVAG